MMYPFRVKKEKERFNDELIHKMRIKVQFRVLLSDDPIKTGGVIQKKEHFYLELKKINTFATT